MTPRQDPLLRLRAANPAPLPVEPDWERVKDRVVSASLGQGLDRPAPATGRRKGPRRGRALGALALCAAVAAGILLALAPGGGSSDFLARAAAALAPEPGAILYERWENTIAEPGNQVYGDGRTFGPERLWIEDDSPHRYRAVLQPDGTLPVGLGLAFDYGVNVGYSVGGLSFPNGQKEVRMLQDRLAGQPLEIAGTVEAPTGPKRPSEVRPTLTFLAPNELLSARLKVTLGPALPGPHDQSIENGADPVSALRAAISEGRAHEAGSAQLDGRAVQRIDINLPDHPPADSPPLPADAPVFHSKAYAYVEPETFHPVEIVYGRDTYRFLAYEYLPATSANLALTSIQSQHPRANIVKAEARRK
jgi:hypothetical protein